MVQTRSNEQGKVLLSRRTAPLLSRVNNVPRAQYDAAHGRNPLPVTDVDAEPISSSDDDSLSITKSSKRDSAFVKPQLSPPQTSISKSSASRLSFAVPPGNSESKTGHKRKRPAERPDTKESESWDGILWSNSQSFSSQRSQTTYGKSTKAIFNKPKSPPKSRKPARPTFKTLPKDDSTNERSFEPKALRMPAASHEEPASSASSPFRMPSSYIDNGSDSALSSPPAGIDLDDDDPPAFSDGITGRCPMCSESVPLEQLEAFRNGAKLRWRDKLAFCREHSTRKATETWTAQSYPSIEWNKLDVRLAALDKQIKALLKEDQHDGFYRRLLAQKVERGTLRKELANPDAADAALPGYYGTRGARLIADYLTRRFGRELRTLARRDPLIVTAGLGGYVQRVLVPEVATLLVVQDYKGTMDEDGARRILSESAGVGGILSGEIEEYVRVHSDSESEVDLEGEMGGKLKHKRNKKEKVQEQQREDDEVSADEGYTQL